MKNTCDVCGHDVRDEDFFEFTCDSCAVTEGWLNKESGD